MRHFTGRVGSAATVGALCIAMAASWAVAETKVLLCTGDYGMWAQDRATLLKEAVGNVAGNKVLFEVEQSFNFVKKLEVPGYAERFDAIVSNPPYVSASEFEALEDSVRLFEPRSALVSDGDGMTLTEALLAGAGAHLATGGLLALEVDAARAERAAQVALELGWSEVRIEHDLFGRPRYLLANRE